jgi:CTP:molybdopterin cytidylyltransferase MocA
VLVPPDVRMVVNPEYGSGMGSSLVTGLTSVLDDDRGGVVDAVLVMLVDLPGVGRAAIDRILAAAHAVPDPRNALLRAAYAGVPGHPVVFGRNHLAGVLASAADDRGARNYLAGRPVPVVECGDVADGADVDRP